MARSGGLPSTHWKYERPSRVAGIALRQVEAEHHVGHERHSLAV